MAQLVITQNQEIKFEDYLKICLLQELYIKKQIATHFNTLPEGLYELQVQEAKLDTIPNELGLTVTYIDRFTNGILEVRINPGYTNASFFPFSTDGLREKYERLNAWFYSINTTPSISIRFDDVIQKNSEAMIKSFKLGEDNYVLTISEVKKKQIKIYPYECSLYIMDIEAQTGERDVYYYDPLKCEFYYDSEAKKLVPKKTQAKLLVLLPSFKKEDLPPTISRFLFETAQIGYFDGYRWKKGVLTFSEKVCLMFDGVKLRTCQILDVPDDLLLLSPVSFASHLESPEEIKESKNTENIIHSIKVMLQKLKENSIDPNQVPKIKLRNQTFYSRISESKKEIDAFFKDPEIIKYCDLSLIDFTNADIENVDLSNTNANIDLEKLYQKSILNAKLRNVNLIRQDLDGILADGADLRGTGIFVSIDKTSIVNTLFSSESVFMLETKILDASEVEKLGIKVEKDEEKDLSLVLKL